MRTPRRPILFLDRSKPSYVGDMLEMANERLYGFWGNLTDALRTGQPQNEAKAETRVEHLVGPDSMVIGIK